MRIVFIGTGDIGLPVLERLRCEHDLLAVVAQPDKPVGRKQTLTPPPTKRWALEHGVPVLQPAQIRQPEALTQIAALRPEVLVVMAYGQILPKTLLELPALACLNLHASLLPKYRGAAPIQAAIEAGERETGVGVMWMNEGLDTGDLLLERRLPIRRRETGGSLHDRLAALAPLALSDALRLLALGHAPRTPQNEALASYAPKLSRENGHIDWHAPADAIHRRIRAMNPWPAAHTWLPVSGELRQLKVFSAIEHRRNVPPGAALQPGTVLQANKHGLLVAAGKGAILLREVQLEGKRRMQARDFLAGHPVQIGTQLGKL